MLLVLLVLIRTTKNQSFRKIEKSSSRLRRARVCRRAAARGKESIGQRRANGKNLRLPHIGPCYAPLTEPIVLRSFAFSTWPELTATIQGKDEPLPGGALLVSGNYHAGLGIRLLLGRLISPEDNRVPGGHPVAVLSYGFWQRKFGGAASAIGQSIVLNGTSYTIIGKGSSIQRLGFCRRVGRARCGKRGASPSNYTPKGRRPLRSFNTIRCGL